MKAAYINPFIESTVSVFTRMLGCQVKRTGIDLHEHFTPKYDITGLIGLSGGATGDVVISFQKELALRATEALTGEHFGDVTEDVIDTVGELTNMIAGSAKTSLAQYEMQLALPTVIVGTNHAIRFPSNVRPISVSFESDWGNFSIEVGLVEEVPAAV
ncbi:MAG: chemotaxis protein CheX [Pirellulales bacterium]